MTKRDKQIEKILNNETIKTSQAIKLIEWLGYESRKTKTTGSHRAFRKAGRDLINIVLTYENIPSYTIDDIKKALELEGYTL